ncbi:uncharacterized protein EV420DRAFT_519436 [Desarmillaria tabescens]|uniref:Uncharacterized protein n=1 Tax=Armillaria tabescens TaxID=1929756 RepID=A0AA39K9Z1_ARMTA|nr:uncharacterized protein EV420DRAFT_519436 [Desarmillaria tabescens]KAK0457311.1 hypothetical protein EV420DRAFT_519436 [Desarmillaria tabescens]
MGPQRSTPRPITSEKDRQIRTIQTSLIHERLIATQRALDTLRITHAEELEAERRASEGLRKKLAVCEERVRDAERERDDMREVVNELVDRGLVVSVSKDFAAWPCSQLRMTSLLDPAELTPPAPPTTPPYAAALIESLSTSLATERKAYTRTTRVAQNTIAVLEAQLALREAELEESWSGCGEEEGMQIGEEEALRVLELNVRQAEEDRDGYEGIEC